MSLIALKLILTPTLIGLASLAGRKWGAAVSGWLVGLPLTSAPIILFLVLEHGAGFASIAARGIILGNISVAVFCLTYSRLAFRFSWPLVLLISLLAFLTTTVVLQRVTLALAPTSVCVFIVLTAVFRLLPVKNAAPFATAVPRWEIPARMIIATSFVLLLTELAGVLGARLSGLLAPFPVFISILAVFTHHFQGATITSRFLRGVILGTFSFALFFLVIALMIERAGILAAFTCAALASLATHSASLFLLNKTKFFQKRNYEHT